MEPSNPDPGSSLIRRILSLPKDQRNELTAAVGLLSSGNASLAFDYLEKRKWKTTWPMLLRDKRLAQDVRQWLRETAYKLGEADVGAAIEQLRHDKKLEIQQHLSRILENEDGAYKQEEIDDAVERGRKALLRIADPGDPGLLYGELADWKRIISLVEENTPMLPSGFNQFDEFTGGFELGSLVMILARTGVGKTMLGIKMALNMLEKGNSTKYFAMEMTEKQMNRRVLASQTRIPQNKLRGRQVKEMSDDEKQKLAEAKEKLTGGFGSFNVTTKADKSSMAAILGQVETGTKALFLDNLRNVRMPDAKQPWQTMDAYMATLKEWAVENDSVAVVFMHLTKDDTTRFATMLEDHCDYIWKMRAGPKDEDDSTAYCVIEQEKSRHDAQFPIGLMIKYDISLVVEDEQAIKELAPDVDDLDEEIAIEKGKVLEHLSNKELLDDYKKCGQNGRKLHKYAEYERADGLKLSYASIAWHLRQLESNKRTPTKPKKDKKKAKKGDIKLAKGETKRVSVRTGDEF